MTKQTIAIDIDDVLADYAEAFVEASNRLFGTKIDRTDYTEDWFALWDVDATEFLRRRDELFKTDMHEVMKPKNDALATIDRLAKVYRLIIITSRHRSTRTATLDWVNAHYPVFREEDVNFSGIWDDDDRTAVLRTKGDIAANLNVDYLIDDQRKHCLAVAERGIKALLFGPQTENDNLHENVTPVADWIGVMEYFNV